ncbi:MAG: 2-amino-4-hydroxy-6-hydroxymethyldihydropteridine diphosphokinase [Verrucomicrobia bacterium]|nr:2-amino-4-hydroxy-6-hydroxymethyldihydropteridine diphosphokinase [Verrucomicrobiota bacterium]
MDGQHKTLIALGSNLGNSSATIRQAFVALEDLSQTPISKSSLWKSDPVDCPPGAPCYINAAVSFSISRKVQAEVFLRQLLKIERMLGRRRSGLSNESRVIDIDLICLGSLTQQSSVLSLPHPRAHLRQFVLAPLNEIEPDFIFPGLKKSTRALLENLPSSEACVQWTEA